MEGLEEVCFDLIENGFTTDMKIYVRKQLTESWQLFNVHQKMVTFGTSFPKKDILHLDNTDPEAFKIILLYLYFHRVSLTDETVKGVVEISRRYGISNLEDSCFDFWMRKLGAQNILTVLTEAEKSNKKEIEDHCIKLTRENPELFREGKISTLSKTELDMLFARDDLPVDEEFIFNSLMAWSKVQCEIDNLDSSAFNKRLYLGETLFKVRFIWLPNSFLYKTVIPSNMLSAEEIAELWQIKEIGKIESQKFLTPKRMRERDGPDVKRLERFVEVCNGEDDPPWECNRNKVQAFSLTVDKPVMFWGVSLYGTRAEICGFYQVLLQVYRGAEVLAELETDVFMKKYLLPEDLTFQTPVRLRENNKYDICLHINGPGTYHGTLRNDQHFPDSEGRPQSQYPIKAEFEQDGVQFCIGRSCFGGPTNDMRGQMPEILYQLPPVGNLTEALVI